MRREVRAAKKEKRVKDKELQRKRVHEAAARRVRPQPSTPDPLLPPPVHSRALKLDGIKTYSIRRLEALIATARQPCSRSLSLCWNRWSSRRLWQRCVRSWRPSARSVGCNERSVPRRRSKESRTRSFNGSAFTRLLLVVSARPAISNYLGSSLAIETQLHGFVELLWWHCHVRHGPHGLYATLGRVPLRVCAHVPDVSGTL